MHNINLVISTEKETVSQKVILSPLCGGHKTASDSKEYTEQYMTFDQVSLAYKMADNWLAND